MRETMTLEQRTSFRSELEKLINSESRENGSNTPDFILAEYLTESLQAFDRAVARREEWYGRDPKSGPGVPDPVIVAGLTPLGRAHLERAGEMPRTNAVPEEPEST